MNVGNNNIRIRIREWWVAGIGAATGLGALIGASCCVLPLVLINLGFSAALMSNLGFFVRAKPYFMVLTVALIVLGLVAAFWKGRRPGSRAIVLLSAASYKASINFKRSVTVCALS